MNPAVSLGVLKGEDRVQAYLEYLSCEEDNILPSYHTNLPLKLVCKRFTIRIIITKREFFQKREGFLFHFICK